MKSRTVAAALAAAAVLVLPASASAGVASTAVAGSGETKIGTQFSFFAAEGGGSFFGTSSFVNPTRQPDRVGDIVCLRISGNRAVMGTEVAGGRFTTFTMQDLGTSAVTPEDRIRGGAITTRAPTCSSVGTVSSRYTIREGDIQVVGLAL